MLKTKIEKILVQNVKEETWKSSDRYSDFIFNHKIHSSLHWCFSYFLCRFCSTGVYSDYTSSFLLHHQYFFVLFKQREGPQSISSAFITAQGRLIHRYLRLYVHCFYLSLVFSANIDDVRGKKRYSWNLLQWSKNNIESKKSTNWDYSAIDLNCWCCISLY